jgi:hypothetical protein
MSLDLNTQAAQLSQIGFVTDGGQSVLGNVTALIPVTNFRETIGSQTTFAPSGSMNFNFILPVPTPGNPYQWIGGVGGGASHGNFTPGLSWDLAAPGPVITQAQFQSLSDPIAFMLETNTPTSVGGSAITDGLLINNASQMTFTAVPTPPILPLLASGLFGLGLARGRKFKPGPSRHAAA